MQRAAVGFRVHSGWAAMVAVALEKAAPIVVARRRLRLVTTFSYTFRQPYHTAEKMEPTEAAAFVHSVEAESRELALAGLRSLKKELEQLEYSLCGGALLLAAGRKLPEFEKILTSHALIHTADGELFREALRRSCSGAGLALHEIAERQLLAAASQRLKKRGEFLNRKLTTLGKALGPPWTQDEKLAALAAWLVFAS